MSEVYLSSGLAHSEQRAFAVLRQKPTAARRMEDHGSHRSGGLKSLIAGAKRYARRIIALATGWTASHDDAFCQDPNFAAKLQQITFR